MMDQPPRDHGGGLDAAMAEFGGTRADWLDLSTGINPVPYPLPELEQSDWTALPDAGAMQALLDAARTLWKVPQNAEIVAAPGASALIARLPYLLEPGTVDIATRTYNEHAAAFQNAGWKVSDTRAAARVIVHPNNPDGKLWDGADERPGGRTLLIIDESFCDIAPESSVIPAHLNSNTVVLKSFGKFWGLAGARLGFAIGPADLIDKLRNMLGPWPVAGPTLRIATKALGDTDWASQTRDRLRMDSNRLDQLMTRKAGIQPLGGTSLFRLYRVSDAYALHTRLAKHHILTRIFPYSKTWLRLGLPADEADWRRLENTLNSAP